MEPQIWWASEQVDTEMEVYQIPDLTECRLLAANLRNEAHHWFNACKFHRLLEAEMNELFMGRFRASVAYAQPANRLANIKPNKEEILWEYFKRLIFGGTPCQAYLEGIPEEFLVCRGEARDRFDLIVYSLIKKIKITLLRGWPKQCLEFIL